MGIGVVACVVMKAATPLRVVWLFDEEDEALARELLRLAAVLARQGIVDNWSVIDIPAGQAWIPEIEEQLLNADVVVLLSSPALVTGAQWWRGALESQAQLLPVILRAGGPGELDQWAALPRGGTPLIARGDRDEAMLEVVQALQEMASRRGGPSSISAAPPAAAQPGLSIDEIFRPDGPPSVTFVTPPHFELLKHELRTMGTGLIVEGPSRTGKSTAIRKALEELGVPESAQTWWYGQDLPELATFEQMLESLVTADRDRWLLIDDFHYVEQPAYLKALAFRMKKLADRPERHGKVTLIGINPLGNSLVSAMPDLAGRYRVLRLDADSDRRQESRIAQLIIQGEQAANIRFRLRDDFIRAASGNFYLAQLLCNRAAVHSDVLEAQPGNPVEISLGPHDVVASIRHELSARYREPLLDFAALHEVQHPRGAALSLLWLLSRSTDGFVSLREARLRFPDLGSTFDWFLASNMSAFFAEHPRLRGLLYFRRDAGTLTMEDPQLKFYLRELDWVELAKASGHGAVTFHPVDGPIWPKLRFPLAGKVSMSGSWSMDAEVVYPTYVLHLSDLHIETNDQATEWYSQLATDLREQGIERLDGVVVSGDIVQRATTPEYDAAANFLGRVMEGFSVRASGIAIVPGNHDVSWPASRSAYHLRRKADVSPTPAPGTFVSHGGDVLEVRDDAAWPRRFEAFATFYQRVTGDAYPLGFADQGTVVTITTDRIIRLVGLNSAWESDHLFPARASIHPLALTRALDELPTPKPGEVRIAVFHHPLQSAGDDRIRDAAFLQRLAIQGFRVVLHGHVHRADSALYRYDQAVDGRKLEIVTAGTFGAPTRAWVPGYPLQYNLLAFEPSRLRVETRCRREVHGAWEPDARWRNGPGADPVPRYFIEL